MQENAKRCATNWWKITRIFWLWGGISKQGSESLSAPDVDVRKYSPLKLHITKFGIKYIKLAWWILWSFRKKTKMEPRGLSSAVVWITVWMELETIHWTYTKKIILMRQISYRERLKKLRFFPLKRKRKTKLVNILLEYLRSSDKMNISQGKWQRWRQ